MRQSLYSHCLMICFVLFFSSIAYSQFGDRLNMGSDPECSPINDRSRAIECRVNVKAPPQNRSSVSVTSVRIRILSSTGDLIGNGSAGYATRPIVIRPGQKGQVPVRIPIRGSIATDSYSGNVSVQYRNNRQVDSSGTTYRSIYIRNSDSAGAEDCESAMMVFLFLIGSVVAWNSRKT